MRRQMEHELANELLIKATQLEHETFVYFNKQNFNKYTKSLHLSLLKNMN